jgi:hypothetical protein
MYERAHHPPVPFPVFLRRLGNHFAIVAALLAVSLAVGMFGFHRLAGYSWIDAFLDTAMLLGGMGPMGPDLPDYPAKLFAGFYALYAACWCWWRRACSSRRSCTGSCTTCTGARSDAMQQSDLAPGARSLDATSCGCRLAES